MVSIMLMPFIVEVLRLPLSRFCTRAMLMRLREITLATISLSTTESMPIADSRRL